MIIGKIIKDLREKHNYTQKEMAKMLHTTPGCISKYETGRIQPPLEMVIQIADTRGTYYFRSGSMGKNSKWVYCPSLSRRKLCKIVAELYIEHPHSYEMYHLLNIIPLCLTFWGVFQRGADVFMFRFKVVIG